MLPVKQDLRLALKRCEISTRYREELSADYRQSMIDKLENSIVDWMTSAAKQTAGIMKFRGGEISAPLSEEHVAKLKALYEQLHHSATQLVVNRTGTREARHQAWQEVKIAKSILRRALRRSRKRLFDAGQDNWARDASGDAKRLACAKSRHDRTQSALDPTKTTEYVQHFRSTIGHPPTATAPIDHDILLKFWFCDLSFDA